MNLVVTSGSCSRRSGTRTTRHRISIRSARSSSRSFPAADETIASFNVRALRALQELLELPTRLVLASERAYPRFRAAQERVICICLEEGGSRYVNPIRARSLGLYDEAAFRAAGLELSYLGVEPDLRYEQNGGPFVPDLSIIDVLMFNSLAQTRELLDRFVLQPGETAP